MNGNIDLGPVTATNTTWWAKAGGEVLWVGEPPAAVHYDQQNCGGNSFMFNAPTAPRRSLHPRSAWGTWLDVTGATAMFLDSSFRDANGCQNRNAIQQFGTPVKDSGAKAEATLESGEIAVVML